MSAKTTSVAVTTALLLLTGTVIIEGIFIFWMQQEINYIKTTINRPQTATVTTEGTSSTSVIQPSASKTGKQTSSVNVIPLYYVHMNIIKYLSDANLYINIMIISCVTYVYLIRISINVYINIYTNLLANYIGYWPLAYLLDKNNSILQFVI